MFTSTVYSELSVAKTFPYFVTARLRKFACVRNQANVRTIKWTTYVLSGMWCEKIKFFAARGDVDLPKIQAEAWEQLQGDGKIRKPGERLFLLTVRWSEKLDQNGWRDADSIAEWFYQIFVRIYIQSWRTYSQRIQINFGSIVNGDIFIFHLYPLPLQEDSKSSEERYRFFFPFFFLPSSEGRCTFRTLISIPYRVGVLSKVACCTFILLQHS